MKNTIKSLKKISTIDYDEITHFSGYSADWWNVNGTYAPLHKMSAARISYIKQILNGKISGKSILDIGCGGGLVSEPLSRLGGHVTGIDADKGAIDIARDHALSQGLDISYICGAAEDLVAQNKKYDVVIALEILEHVSSPMTFIQMCGKLLKPGGVIIFSTLNRTWKSYALGIFVAERILSWAPPNTHHWNKFIKPSELSRMINMCDLETIDACGLVYKPLNGEFDLSPHDLDINFFMVATSKK